MPTGTLQTYIILGKPVTPIRKACHEVIGGGGGDFYGNINAF